MTTTNKDQVNQDLFSFITAVRGAALNESRSVQEKLA
jgi:hypothetical protein